LLLRTVEFFTKREDVQEIIVAGPENDFPSFQERFGPALSFHGVIIAEGGSTRSITVKNALSKVSETIDIVVVHDAARPAITNALFDALLVACATFPAVAPALQINGTLKRTGNKAESVADEDAIADSILGADSQTSIEAFKVEETVDRANLWEMQTPQCFELSLLKRAYSNNDIENCTDDAQVVEKIGEPVYLINGDSRNIKVTTLEDFQLVKAILGLKGESERPAHKRF
ncbi:MAG TPA: hypothetical protein EYM90_06285, partial [Phycisphaerales bacterium]|nr:hypothetical protein [Phycisphaerales bacterium]